MTRTGTALAMVPSEVVFEHLPNRSKEILTLIIAGHTYKSVAKHLKISENTVKHQVRIIGMMAGLTEPHARGGLVSALLLKFAEHIEPVAEGSNGNRAWDSLTDQEKRLTQMVVGNMSAREIAAQMKITPGTVRNQVSKVYDKVGVSTRLELIAWHLAHFRNYSSLGT